MYQLASPVAKWGSGENAPPVSVAISPPPGMVSTLRFPSDIKGDARTNPGEEISN